VAKTLILDAICTDLKIAVSVAVNRTIARNGLRIGVINKVVFRLTRNEQTANREKPKTQPRSLYHYHCSLPRSLLCSCVLSAASGTGHLFLRQLKLAHGSSLPCSGDAVGAMVGGCADAGMGVDADADADANADGVGRGSARRVFIAVFGATPGSLEVTTGALGSGARGSRTAGAATSSGARAA
jgi:hypothetical protein